MASSISPPRRKKNSFFKNVSQLFLFSLPSNPHVLSPLVTDEDVRGTWRFDTVAASLSSQVGMMQLGRRMFLRKTPRLPSHFRDNGHTQSRRIVITSDQFLCARKSVQGLQMICRTEIDCLLRNGTLMKNLVALYITDSFLAKVLSTTLEAFHHPEARKNCWRQAFHQQCPPRRHLLGTSRFGGKHSW